MKFYEFNDYFPYTALIYAENEEQAFKAYQEQVCDLEEKDLKLELHIIEVDTVAKEIHKNALNNIFPDFDGVKIFGVGNWFFNILICEEATVVFIDTALY